MNAILAAGGIPKPGEPFYEYTAGGYKAFLKVAGKPMVQWVLDTLSGSDHVDRVILVGPQEHTGLTCTKALTFLSDQGGIIDNIRAAARKVRELDPDSEYLLMVFSDIPLITPEMLDWVVDNSRDDGFEVYLSMVPRQSFAARFPGLKRRFTRLNDIELREGDINVFKVDLVLQDGGLGDRLAEARESLVKRISLIGLDTLLLLLLRRLDLNGFVKHISRRSGISWKPLICPYPEIAMDVDNPSHLELVRAELAERASQ